MNRKLLASASILIGLLSICTQFASYDVTRQVVDYVSSGVWGGILMITSATLILLDKPNKENWILAATCLSLLSGLVMLVLYSWNLDRFFKVYTTAAICEFYAPGLLIDPSLCKEFVTIHGLMITLGLFAVLINAALLFEICRRPPTPGQFYFYKSGPSNVRNTLI